MQHLVGSLLAQFRVDEELGEGGMGVVYRATDQKLQRPVALKVLADSLLDDPAARRRFVREARTAAAVHHPNVAAVFDVGESDGRLFIAMELVEGETLRDRLERGLRLHRLLSVAETVRVATDIASGLAAAHAKGITHRDLKPENVMMTRDDRAKILDFGLAKLREDTPRRAIDLESAETFAQTQAGHILGTPSYMSPEQARGEAVGVRADVFSLGVMLYEMLTGERPFRGGNPVAILVAVTRVTPKPPSARNPEVPAEVDRVVARCLEKDPARRYASATAVAAALADWASRASPLLPATPASPPPPAPRGRGWVTLAMGVATLALLVGAALVARPWVRRRAAVSEVPEVTSAGSFGDAGAAPVTLATLPLPASTVGEALTEYREGLQLQRDDSSLNAQRHFLRAGALDPSMAVAHLRAAITGLGAAEPDVIRAEFAKAQALREQLGERDRVLLDAFEPVAAHAQPDARETTRRLEDAVERAPRDEELVGDLASMLAGDPPRCVAYARKATELDPLDAQAFETLGRGLAAGGDLPGARAAFERCADISANSSDCDEWLETVDEESGECVEMERRAHRYADIDPKGGNRRLAGAMAALGRPESAVQGAIDQYLAALPADVRDVEREEYAVRLAMLAGRFDAALEALGRLDRTLAASSARSAFDHNHFAAFARAETLLETGAPADVVAKTFLDRSATMTRSLETWRSEADLLWFRRVAGRPLDADRAALLSALRTRPESGAVSWALAWAAPAMTREDAAAALAALDRDPWLALPRGGESLTTSGADGAAGHVEVLAGRWSEAIPFLRVAARSCGALRSPFTIAHARLDLGAALERTGDHDAACVAYGGVVSMWGKARPRSVTADKARERARVLACARAG